MRQVSDVMTRGVRTLSPDDTVMAAAQAMQELDVGVIPEPASVGVLGLAMFGLTVARRRRAC